MSPGLVINEHEPNHTLNLCSTGPGLVGMRTLPTIASIALVAERSRT